MLMQKEYMYPGTSFIDTAVALSLSTVKSTNTSDCRLYCGPSLFQKDSSTGSKEMLFDAITSFTAGTSQDPLCWAEATGEDSINKAKKETGKTMERLTKKERIFFLIIRFTSTPPRSNWAHIS